MSYCRYKVCDLGLSQIKDDQCERNDVGAITAGGPSLHFERGSNMTIVLVSQPKIALDEFLTVIDG